MPDKNTVYLASSWRNQYHTDTLGTLRGAGYTVYDFKNPLPGDEGFHWSEIDPHWLRWDPETFRKALQHDLARQGFSNDFRAMMASDVCVLLLPAGRSAHLEAGWFAGSGKPTLVYIPEPVEPEMMYLLADGVHSEMPALIRALDRATGRAYRG